MSTSSIFESVFVDEPGPFDTCAKCGKRALVRIMIQLLPGESDELLYCGHHFDNRSDVVKRITVGYTDVREFDTPDADQTTD